MSAISYSASVKRLCATLGIAIGPTAKNRDARESKEAEFRRKLRKSVEVSAMLADKVPHGMNTSPVILTDDHMPPDISRDTRWLVNAITVVKDLEHRLPLINSITEVQELKHQASGLAKWAEAKKGGVGEWHALAKELYNWAIRVGMMCQRRTGQLLNEQNPAKGGRPPKKTSPPSGPVSEPPPKPEVTLASQGISKNYASDAKVLANTPEKELSDSIDKQLADTGRITKKKLIKQARAKQTGLFEKQTVFKKNSPSDRFDRYWNQERRLLTKSFETPDLEKVGDYWWREFHKFRIEQEKTLAEYRQDNERRKAAVELAKP